MTSIKKLAILDCYREHPVLVRVIFELKTLKRIQDEPIRMYMSSDMIFIAIKKNVFFP